MRITWRCEGVGAGGLDEEEGELGWQRVVRLLQSGGYGWSEGGVATWNTETTTTPPVCIRCGQGVSRKRRKHYLCIILFWRGIGGARCMVEADGCLLDLLTAVPACANSDSLYAMTCSTGKTSPPMFGFAGRLTFNSMYGR